jgi:conserved oligomeric Golgi complex subunit 2
MHLHVQLVEVINEDYADFVSLSTQLVNVDGAVARMQRPLGDLKVLRDQPGMPQTPFRS